MRIPPARAAQLTDHVLATLPPPPARVLEVGFAGIHAEPPRLAGYTVDVLDEDPGAVERAGGAFASPPAPYDAVAGPADADLTGIDAARVIRL